MPSSAKQAETTAFDAVRATPFTRIHGRPTRANYDLLKSEAGALASEVEDMTYAWSKNATDNYGLLADIIGADEYDDLTNIDTYVVPNEPPAYDPTITNATLTHERKRKEEEWDEIRQSWFIRKGFLRGVSDNLRDALDEQYYSQLRHRLTAYRNVTPFQILEHLNDRWCPLDVQAKKELRRNYYTKWDADEHLTAFGKRLNDDQLALVRSDVGISDEDKLQFYLEEIYDSNKFDKQDMLAWEKLPVITKTDFELTRSYFEDIVKATDAYDQNAGGANAKHNKYESANQLADCGDEIREWIQQIATNGADHAANNHATEKLATMEAEIKKLTATITLMASKLAANGENANPNTATDRESRRPQMKKLRNMGAYCHSHGFHPAGEDHTSATCSWKKEGHKDEATWTNRMGGDEFWPTAKRVATAQQEHTTWKGKAAPTN
jgi:hypothetical protein